MRPTVVKKKLPSGDGAPITSFCRTNLEIQGNLGFSDEDLLTHCAGFRFAYQITVGRLMNRPKLPPRTNQSRFSCAIATVWLAITIYFFATGRAAAGTAMGVGLLIPAGLVGFFDVCLPSMLFNAVVYRRLKPRQPS